MVGQALWAETVQDPGEAGGVLRFDPISVSLKPVAPEEVKVGYVYNHYSRRLGHRVWSYVQPDGTFWNAFGEGTTQEAWRLDLRITPQQGYEKIAAIDPELAKKLNASGAPVFLRLGNDGKWSLVSTASFPTVYDAETGHRWERHFKKYIPVSSTSGYRWAVVAGKYTPQAHVPQARASGRTLCRQCSGG
ncbi:MAG: hypothetical protein JXB62_08215 [Pirellulales bacterium]|nr:hypothetical protein [Pirellulales bacterium]